MGYWGSTQNLKTFRESGKPRFYGWTSCASKNAISRCNIKSGFPDSRITNYQFSIKTLLSKRDMPNFQLQNCCHAPEIARTANFLADSKSL